MANKTNEEEIIEFYKTNGIHLRKEDLNHPTKDFVLNLYKQILEQLDVKNLDRPDILACTNLSDHMIQGYFQINIYKALNKFVSSVGLCDLKYSDICMPKRARTLKILHALATYYIRYGTIKAQWFEFAEKYSQSYQEKKELEKRKSEFKHSIEEKSMLLSSLKNKSIGLEKELKDLEELFAKKKSEAEKEAQKATDLKTEICSLKDKLCEIQIENEKTIEFNKKLSQTIIESPQKLIETKNELEAKLESIKNEYPGLKSKENDLLLKKSRVINAKQILTNTIKELGELQLLNFENDEQSKELEEIIDNMTKLDEEIKQLEIKKKNVESTIQSLKVMINKENAKYLREKKVLEDLLNGLIDKNKNNQNSMEKIDDSVQLDRLKIVENELEELNEREQELWEKQDLIYKNNLEKILKTFKLLEQIKLK